jgi:hypothetical protein
MALETQERNANTVEFFFGAAKGAAFSVVLLCIRKSKVQDRDVRAQHALHMSRHPTTRALPRAMDSTTCE